MTRDEINAYCATLPGSESSDPWGGGHDVWKVGGKSYVFMGADRTGMSVKCDSQETADMLIEVGAAEKAPYLTRGGWVHLKFANAEEDEIRHRLKVSYLTVRRSLTKKLQVSLGPEPE